MSNPLYQTLGGKTPTLPNMGNMQNFMTQLQQFQKTFTGNPRQQVQELLNSGKMTQNQFTQLQNTVMQMFPNAKFN